MNGDMSSEVQANTKREPIELSISGLVNDLKNGIVRCKDDLGYDVNRGSIEEKYGLTKAEVKEIFKEPKLAGLKVRIPKEVRYKLVDDTENISESIISNKKGYGVPTKSAIERAEKGDLTGEIK